jgi:hypothetical protein
LECYDKALELGFDFEPAKKKREEILSSNLDYIVLNFVNDKSLLINIFRIEVY